MNVTLHGYRDAEFDLEALTEAARQLLLTARIQVADGRVAGALDTRGVRYYQTMGILDRPLRYDGRRAVYGFRHLLQLLAIRTLQSEGYPLALIQTALPPRTTAELEDAVGRALGTSAPVDADRSPELPVAAAPGAAAIPVDAAPAFSTRPPAAPAPHNPATAGAAPRAVLVAEVAPGITLTIDPARVAGADTLFARLAAHIIRAIQED